MNFVSDHEETIQHAFKMLKDQVVIDGDNRHSHKKYAGNELIDTTQIREI